VSRFGVLLAFLGSHLPDDERPGLHLAIELALPLLLALLLALLGCRHRFSLVVACRQRYASVSEFPAIHQVGFSAPETAGAILAMYPDAR
jgi:hypothetical protein